MSGLTPNASVLLELSESSGSLSDGTPHASPEAVDALLGASHGTWASAGYVSEAPSVSALELLQSGTSEGELVPGLQAGVDLSDSVAQHLSFGGVSDGSGTARGRRVAEDEAHDSAGSSRSEEEDEIHVPDLRTTALLVPSTSRSASARRSAPTAVHNGSQPPARQPLPASHDDSITQAAHAAVSALDESLDGIDLPMLRTVALSVPGQVSSAVQKPAAANAAAAQSRSSQGMAEPAQQHAPATLAALHSPIQAAGDTSALSSADVSAAWVQQPAHDHLLRPRVPAHTPLTNQAVQAFASPWQAPSAASAPAQRQASPARGARRVKRASGKAAPLPHRRRVRGGAPHPGDRPAEGKKSKARAFRRKKTKRTRRPVSRAAPAEDVGQVSDSGSRGTAPLRHAGAFAEKVLQTAAAGTPSRASVQSHSSRATSQRRRRVAGGQKPHTKRRRRKKQHRRPSTGAPPHDNAQPPFMQSGRPPIPAAATFPAHLPPPVPQYDSDASGGGPSGAAFDATLESMDAWLAAATGDASFMTASSVRQGTPHSLYAPGIFPSAAPPIPVAYASPTRALDESAHFQPSDAASPLPRLRQAAQNTSSILQTSQHAAPSAYPPVAVPATAPLAGVPPPPPQPTRRRVSAAEGRRRAAERVRASRKSQPRRSDPVARHRQLQAQWASQTFGTDANRRRAALQAKRTVQAKGRPTHSRRMDQGATAHLHPSGDVPQGGRGLMAPWV